MNHSFIHVFPRKDSVTQTVWCHFIFSLIHWCQWKGCIHAAFDYVIIFVSKLFASDAPCGKGDWNSAFNFNSTREQHLFSETQHTNYFQYSTWQCQSIKFRFNLTFYEINVYQTVFKCGYGGIAQHCSKNLTSDLSLSWCHFCSQHLFSWEKNKTHWATNYRQTAEQSAEETDMPSGVGREQRQS